MRPYQVACLQAIDEAYARGVRSMMAVLATGLGKTAIVSDLIRRLDVSGETAGKAAWFVAHRDELLRQGWKSIRRQNPGLTLDAEKADLRAHPGASVVFASISTLRSERLLSLGSRFRDRVRLVVIDEAHRSAASHYRSLIAFVRSAYPQALILGLTASSQRADGVGLADLFEEIVYDYSLQDGIRDGYLVPVIGRRIRTHVSLEGVSQHKNGSFVESDLLKYIDRDERNNIVVSAILRECVGRRTLVFAEGVTHAQRLAEQLSAAGFPSVAVWGDTKAIPHRERLDILEKFRQGVYQGLVGADLFIEGFDDPGISAIAWARKTTSPVVYTQGTGRGTRPHGSIAAQLGFLETREERLAAIARSPKPNCLVLDFVDISSNLSLQSLPSLFGLDYKIRHAGTPEEICEISTIEEADIAERCGIRLGARAEVQAKIVGVSNHDVDLIEGAGAVRLPVGKTELAWYDIPGGLGISFKRVLRPVGADGRVIPYFLRAYHLATQQGNQRPQEAALRMIHALAMLPCSLRVSIVQRSPDDPYVSTATETTEDGTIFEYSIGENIRVAPLVRETEKWLRIRYPYLIRTHSVGASWRFEPPSENQRRVLQARGLPVPKTRGEASRILGAIL